MTERTQSQADPIGLSLVLQATQRSKGANCQDVLQSTGHRRQNSITSPRTAEVQHRDHCGCCLPSSYTIPDERVSHTQALWLDCADSPQLTAHSWHPTADTPQLTHSLTRRKWGRHIPTQESCRLGSRWEKDPCDDRQESSQARLRGQTLRPVLYSLAIWLRWALVSKYKAGVKNNNTYLSRLP